MELIMREIRLADIDDFNILMDQLSSRASSEKSLLLNIKKAIDKDDMYLMVAEDKEKGKLCGSMLGLLCEDFCDECRTILFIENVITDVNYRRMGVAREMFKAMEAWGRTQDVHYAVLCSAMNRKEAHHFYRDIGYSEVKGFKKYL